MYPLKTWFAIYMRQVRKEKKLSQVEMAEAMGVNDHFISEIETFRFNPSLITIDEFFRKIGVTVEDFALFILNTSRAESEKIILRDWFSESASVRNDIIKILKESDYDVDAWLRQKNKASASKKRITDFLIPTKETTKKRISKRKKK